MRTLLIMIYVEKIENNCFKIFLRNLRSICRNTTQEDLELSAISPSVLDHLWFPDVEIRFLTLILVFRCIFSTYPCATLLYQCLMGPNVGLGGINWVQICLPQSWGMIGLTDLDEFSEKLQTAFEPPPPPPPRFGKQCCTFFREVLTSAIKCFG